MPNYAKIEIDLLSADQQALCAATRRPAINALTDDALLVLLDNLATALAGAGPLGEDAGPVTPADLIVAAQRRAIAERRRRGIRVPGGRAPRAAKAKEAAVPAAKEPIKKVPAGSSRPARVTTRKPAGRKTAETRKTDLRTGLRADTRRGAKAASKPAAVEKITTDDVARKTADATVAAVKTKPAAAKPAPVKKPKPAATQADVTPVDSADADARKARKKAAKQAARKAAKVAEKEAKQAARKAEKAAIRTARKAAKQAAKEAEKAARKAEAKAARKAAKAAGEPAPKKAGKKPKA